MLDDLPLLVSDPPVGRSAISAVGLAAARGADPVGEDDQPLLRPADPEILELDRLPARSLRYRLDGLAPLIRNGAAGTTIRQSASMDRR